MAMLKNWEIARHGIEYPDYFPGCGTCFTDFDFVDTGIGATEWEALQDALESMAQSHNYTDTEFTEIETSNEGKEISENMYSVLDYLKEYLPAGIDPEDVDTPWYYVSIRYNLHMAQFNGKNTG